MRLSLAVEAVVAGAAIAAASWWILHPRGARPAPTEGAAVETAAKPSPPKTPDLSTEEGLLQDLRENHVAAAVALLKVAELPETPWERRRHLWKEITALDEGFIEKAGPLLEEPKYQAPEYMWLQEEMICAGQRLRVLRDRLKTNAQSPK